MSIISDISNMPIGVFDSGFGGLTVLKQLLKILPNENYIYLGDNINIPYGDKTKEEIEKLTFKMADFLINQKCKMLVIACNTISACSYSILKDKYQIPIIEVISNGVKDALNNTKNNNIYIIGTEFTIQSNAYKNEINKYNKINKNNKVKITQLACRKLCPMIENDWSSYDNRLEVLNSYLENIDENSDTLILACTHYTHILDDIKNLLQNNIKNNIKNIIETDIKEIIKKDDNTFEYKGIIFRHNLIGDFNLYNILSALKAAELYNADLQKCADILSSYESQKNRMQIMNIKGCNIINDCYNSNPTALKNMLKFLSQRRESKKIAVIGDMLETETENSSYHKEIGNIINELKNIDTVIAVGNLSKDIYDTINCEKYYFEDSESSIKKVTEFLKYDTAMLIKASLGMKFSLIIDAVKNI